MSIIELGGFVCHERTAPDPGGEGRGGAKQEVVLCRRVKKKIRD